MDFFLFSLWWGRQAALIPHKASLEKWWSRKKNTKPFGKRTIMYLYNSKDIAVSMCNFCVCFLLVFFVYIYIYCISNVGQM